MKEKIDPLAKAEAARIALSRARPFADFISNDSLMQEYGLT